MNCLYPIRLKNGIVVPCGKCEICRSDRRNEWSIRLAIHLQSCDYMPMFITLTYDDSHLPFVYDNDFPDVPVMTLLRDDVSKFLKAYKRKYCLDNNVFQYFGCGEYGGKLGRPHYHLLFFGDFDLYSLWLNNSEDAQRKVSEVWNKGFVHIGIAGFDGIHYVTKYCLKEDFNELHPQAVKPFTIASNGIGMNFLKSPIGLEYKRQIGNVMRNRNTILDSCPDFDVHDIDSLNFAIDYFEHIVPSFKVILDDGRTVFLPRAIRKKLMGSLEHFKDSPFWLFTHLKLLRDSFLYYKQYGEYDKQHDMNKSYQACLTRLEKIKKRIFENKYNNKRFRT